MIHRGSKVRFYQGPAFFRVGPDMGGMKPNEYYEVTYVDYTSGRATVRLKDGTISKPVLIDFLVEDQPVPHEIGDEEFRQVIEAAMRKFPGGAREIAEQVMVSVPTVKRWLRGRTSHQAMRDSIVRALS